MDNTTILKFKNLSISTMNGFLEEVYDLPVMYTFLAIDAVALIFPIIFLKKWFDNKAKNEKLTVMIVFTDW